MRVISATASSLRGWLPLLLLPPLIFAIIPSAWPRWAFMSALAMAIYAGCKWLTWQRTPVQDVPFWIHLGYLFAWPGMDARSFLQPPQPSDERTPLASEWLTTSARIAVGAALIWGASNVVPVEWDLLVGWLGMFGIVLMLHFGLFGLLSCLWRSLGVNAQPLMNSPARSCSVAEFWGKRWNTAFRDLTYRFLFRPLAGRVPPALGVAAGFLFSGLIHDLVISVPAGGGYGWPTLYFVLQIPALLLERSPHGRRIGLGRGWRGGLFAFIVLAAPAYYLFHPPFVRNIILPLLHALRAF